MIVYLHDVDSCVIDEINPSEKALANSLLFHICRLGISRYMGSLSISVLLEFYYLNLILNIKWD